MSDTHQMKELLQHIKEYIETMEVEADMEWGCCRSLQQLIKDNDMPTIYNDILTELSKKEE